MMLLLQVENGQGAGERPPASEVWELLVKAVAPCVGTFLPMLMYRNLMGIDVNSTVRRRPSC